MASMMRSIRRNRAANVAQKQGMSRSEFFEWRRQYISQLEKQLSNTKNEKKRKEIQNDIQSLKNYKV